MSQFATSRFCCAALCLFVLGTGMAWGQEASTEEDKELPQWTYTATASLNGSQAAFKDWEEGAGTSSLAFTAGVGGKAEKRAENWIQNYELDLGFGIINQEEQQVRKSEDKIDFNTSLRYKGEGFFRTFTPTIAGTFRSQFAKGFDYDADPFEGEVDPGDDRLGQELPVQTSAFLAPAFITESIGLTYEPITDLTIRFGAASKQTVVREKDFRVLYGVDEDQVAEVEGGAELAVSFDRALSESIRYQSQFNAFYSINQSEDLPDARWQNTLNLKVNDWLSTNVALVGLFDKDISNEIQLKETLSVGVSFTLI